ncbi:hypothetical protein [Psychromonas sp. 14N.309.X.WAT.B.A12]|jgi:hypothetical protein|uniref:hypothetical protein n=1 Tax=unclassified Psychromonas TaxID=2614957 RepID=UPI0025AF6EE6|nr:hypothetical protein [Psychromonas sp. 14N.309.X.WAT.B.A12]MDN2662183.1 hypothetical protein [Psychromonas sp. 14N.309.X.WAT.B.A12]
MKKTLSLLTAGLFTFSFALTTPAYASNHHGASAHHKHKVSHQKNVRQVQKIKKRRAIKNRVKHRSPGPVIQLGLHGPVISLFFSPRHSQQHNRKHHGHRGH